MIDRIGIDEILLATCRCAYSTVEANRMQSFLAHSQRRGRDVRAGVAGEALTRADWADLLGNGIAVLFSPNQLQASFLFAKLDAGRSRFGRQRAAFSTFIGDPTGLEYRPSRLFTKWVDALFTISELFHKKGFR